MLPPKPAPSVWQRAGLLCKNPKSRGRRAKCTLVRLGRCAEQTAGEAGWGGRSEQARQFLLMSLLKILATKRSNCK